jgi:hypothetical protein
MRQSRSVKPGEPTMNPYTVIVETTENRFAFEFEARRFAREESKWENTKHVRDIDIIGDFVPTK